uniref:transposase n=1 Tax=Tautonia marina TaxID=2653855 RepID=UPI00126103D4|nr:transposase [Tautonia marina]
MEFTHVLAPSAHRAGPRRHGACRSGRLPHGNTYMALRDELGTVFRDEDFAALFPTRGRPAETPWRLALVTVFQFIEGLSDRRAADAVRGRIDWKYALSLGLDDSGFDTSVLCEFRARLVDGSAVMPDGSGSSATAGGPRSLGCPPPRRADAPSPGRSA